MELTAEMIADIRAKAENYVESEKEDFFRDEVIALLDKGDDEALYDAFYIFRHYTYQRLLQPITPMYVCSPYRTILEALKQRILRANGNAALRKMQPILPQSVTFSAAI